MAAAVVHTLGIDLASQARTTGVCLLAWHADQVEVPYLARGADAAGPLDDDRLVALMLEGLGPGTRPGKVGIDAPLGWPVAFVTALGDLDAWPLEDEVDPRRLVKRATDRYIQREVHKVPLSVSADRIAYPAMRAQRLLRRYRRAGGPPVDRSGRSGVICEVYPDPGVTRFGLRARGSERLSYKAADGTTVRRALLDQLLERAPWLGLAPDQQASCVLHDDSFDALIAALLARAVQLGLTEDPPPDMEADALREGWIHLAHEGTLERLAPQLTSPAPRRGRPK